MEENKKNIKKSISSTPKGFMIPFLLISLRGVDLHGYKLIQKLISFGFPAIDQGNVYRTLRQLEKDNLVHSKWDTEHGGPAKRIYSLTKAGEDYLKLWAKSLEQYQTMLDSFFNMYSNFYTDLFKIKDDEDE